MTTRLVGQINVNFKATVLPHRLTITTTYKATFQRCNCKFTTVIHTTTFTKSRILLCLHYQPAWEAQLVLPKMADKPA